MSAAAPATAFTLQHQADFERNVTRCIAAGAAAAVVQHLAYKGMQLVWASGPRPFPSPTEAALLPLAWLAIAGAVWACARGDVWDRRMLIALGIALPAVPWLLGMSLHWTVVLSGAVGGVLLVRSQRCAVGDEGQLGNARAGRFHYALGAALSGALAVGGLEVAQTLTQRLLALSAPSFVIAALAGAVFALFFGLGQIAAHLALDPDPVEARCNELLAKLSGELRTLSTRALELYRACGKILGQLPHEPAREELAQSLGNLTREAVEVAAEWANVEAQLQGRAQSELGAQIQDLEKSASAAHDPLARRQLQSAAASLAEEKARLDELSLRRERVIARLKSDLAQLERARISLLGVQLGNAEVRAAELASLSRRLQSLTASQTEHAQLADAVATELQTAAVARSTALKS